MKLRKLYNRGFAAHSSTWMGLCTITFCVFSAEHTMAQSAWSGTAGINWNDAGNWDTTPIDNGALTFGGSPTDQPSNNDFPALITGNILFTNNGIAGTAPNNVTTAFTLSGNAVTLGGNITTTSTLGSGGVTAVDINDLITLNLILNGTRTITTNSSGGPGGGRLGHNLTISGQISDAGAGHGLTKTGLATLSLENVNNPFSGPININGGVVNASVLEVSGSASSIGTGSVVNFGGGALRFTGSTALSGDFNRAINLTSTTTAGGTIENNSVSVPLTISGTFTSADSAGNKAFGIGGSNILTNVLASSLVNHNGGGVLGITKVGVGNWTLTGNNTYTGLTDINQGTLSVATIADSGSSNLGPGTEFRLGTAGQTGNLNYTGTGATTTRRLRTGGTVATAAGVGAIQASAANGTSTGLKFTAPNFIVQTAATAARTLTLGGTNTDANEISGIITNHGTGPSNGFLAITKVDAGTWILSGSNTYTGITTLTGGTLQVNSASNGLGDSVAANAINLNGGTLSLRNNGAGSGGSIDFGNASLPSGYPVQLSANSTINVDNLSANTGNTIRLGPLNQATQAARTLTVTGSNGYSLTLPSLGLCPTGGNNTTLNPTTASVTVTGNVTNPMSGFTSAQFCTLTLGGTATGNRIQGIISDAAGSSSVLGGFTRITKSGTSTWELSGANTNSGVIAVTDGMLLITGNSSGATGAVTVSGGALGGTGSIGGAINVTANGSLSPGNNAAGSFTCAGLSLGAMANGGSGKLNFELGPIASSDKIVVTGNLALGGGALGVSDFNFSALVGLTNGTYPLITGASAVTGSLNAGNLTGLIGGGKQGELQLSGNDVVLIVSDGVADPFLAWADNNPSVLFDGDENNDGVENGQAWFLGAANPTADATGLLPKSSQTAGALVLEFDSLDSAARGGAVFQVDYSSDLTAWAGTDIPDTVGTFTAGVVDFVVTDPAPADGLLKVVATIPLNQASAGKLFGRIHGVK